MIRPLTVFIAGLTMLASSEALFFSRFKNPLWALFERKMPSKFVTEQIPEKTEKLAAWIPGSMRRWLQAQLDKDMAEKTKKTATGGAEKVREGVTKTGQNVLAAGEFFGACNMIAAGILTQQPGMLIGGLVKLIPAGVLPFTKAGEAGGAMRNFASTADNFAGALFTVGFANEIKNKDKDTPRSHVRRYDMTHFKSLFKRGALPENNNFFKRIGGIAKELFKMMGFFVMDHVVLARDIWKTRFFLKPENRYAEPGAPPPPKRPHQSFVEWAKDPSANKCEAASLFFYLGSLPVLALTLFGKRLLGSKAAAEKIANSIPFVLLKLTALIIANIPVLAIALNRHDAQGRSPLFGVPLMLLGTNSIKGVAQNAFIGMGQIGGSMGELFQSDVALHGVRTHDEQKKHHVLPMHHKAPNAKAPQPLDPKQTEQLALVKEEMEADT